MQQFKIDVGVMAMVPAKFVVAMSNHRNMVPVERDTGMALPDEASLSNVIR